MQGTVGVSSKKIVSCKLCVWGGGVSLADGLEMQLTT